MTRVELPELTAKQPFIVKRADYEADLKQGFTVLEHEPAREMVVRNPRQPDQTIRRPISATLVFRCMRCQYDAADSTYTPDPENQAKRTGLDLIRKHLEMGKHPWPYNAFESPYGNVQDVIIEGVEDYTKEIDK